MNLNTSIKNDYIYEYLSNTYDVKGVIHISHGMAEHIGRYKWLIKKLNNDGFHVVAIDHRGHGKRIKDNQIHGPGFKHISLNQSRILRMRINKITF